MKKELKILMVDDHPVILEAYTNILESEVLRKKYSFEVDTAVDCDAAIKKINIAAKSNHYDVLFLDIQLPSSSDGKIISGEDLAIYAKESLVDAKILILTTYNDNHRIQNILKTIDPDALVIKDDLTSKELLIALDTIMTRPPYYSATVSKFFRKKIRNQEPIVLDDLNRKIIYYLAKGIKTKDLSKYVPLSLSAIEKRKVQIRKILNLESNKVEELISVAKNKGFI